MSEHIVVDGKQYISVKRAAEITGYSKDYIGQLCRAGNVGATRPGRNWWVDESSLIQYKNNADEVIKTRARYFNAPNAAAVALPVVAKPAPAVSVPTPVSIPVKTPVSEGVLFSYERDERPLIPELKKAEPATQVPKPAQPVVRKTPVAVSQTPRVVSQTSPFFKKLVIAGFVLAMGTGTVFAFVPPQEISNAVASIETTAQNVVTAGISDVGTVVAAIADVLPNAGTFAQSSHVQTASIGDWWHRTSGALATTIRNWLGIGGVPEIAITSTSSLDTSVTGGIAAHTNSSVATSTTIYISYPVVASNPAPTPNTTSRPQVIYSSAPATQIVPQYVSTTVYQTDPTIQSQLNQLQAQLDLYKDHQTLQADSLAYNLGQSITALSAGGIGSGGGGGSGSVTSVDILGGGTGLTFSGGPITSSGAFTLGGILTPANGGTGTSTIPTRGQVLIGNGSGGYSLVATSTLGLGGSGAVDSVSNSDGSLTIGPTTGSVVASLNPAHANTFSALQTFNNASTTQLSVASNLYLSSLASGELAVDVNGKVYAGATTTFAGPLTYSGGVASIQNALADGSTKGAASFNANDFDATSGNISIDYVNGQKASGSQSGFLSSADWTTFNNKQATLSVTGPITLTGSTLGFSGISTSTGAVVGNIPYFSSLNTVANVATGTVTCVGTISCGTGSYVIGSNLTITGSASGAAYPFNLAGNATSTLTQFNGGLTAFASSTIGNGGANGLTINGNATTTGTAYLANAVLTGIVGSTQCLHVDSTGHVTGTGSDCGSGSSLPYAFGLAGNATSTLTQFNGGLTAFASSTVGNGTRTGGLTINGGATTTGTAYFAGNVGIGTTSPSSPLQVVYSDNTFNRGISVKNTNTGINAITGIKLQDSSGNDKGIFDYLAPNYNNASIANTVLFGTPDNTKLAFIGGTGTGNPDIYFQSGASAIPAIYIKGSTNTVGIGTTSPWRALSVNGSSDLGVNALAGSFTATSSVASIFPYASSTALTVSGTGYLADAYFTGITGSTQCLHVDSTGHVTGTGADCSAAGIAYPFGLAGNATSTLTQFNGGLTAYASSTVGNGTLGLTVNGTATTTGNAYFGANIGIGSTSPSTLLAVSGNTASPLARFAQVGGLASIALIGNVGGSAQIDLGDTADEQAGRIQYLNTTDTLNFYTADTQKLTILSNGNVGVGTTSPNSLLSVGNTNGINFSTATSTFFSTGGINLTAGCFAIAGTCLPTSVGLSFAYPFVGNATSTLLAFNGGLTAFASSTIGNGTANGGLTIFGNATTTGTAYIADAVLSNITGSTQCLHVDTNGHVTGTGADCSAGGIAYPFGLAGNATSTLTQFNGGLTAFASSTIGNGSALGGLTINGAATTTGNAYFAGNVGINTVPSGSLTIMGTSTATTTNVFDIVNNTNFPLFHVDGSGFVGIGTSSNLNGFSQAGVLSLAATTSFGWQLLMSDTAMNAHSMTSLFKDNHTFGDIRMGTNAGGVEVLGITSGNRTGLTLTGSQGASSFNNAIPSVLIKGTGQTGLGQGTLAGNSTLMQISNLNTVVQTIMGNGSLGEGTSTPWAFLSLNSASTSQPLIAVSTTTGQNLMILDSQGRLGLGTTTPYRVLSVVGSSDLGTNALAGSFTATSTVASQFPYASSTALTASTVFATTLCLSADCRTIWPTSGGSGGGTWSTTTSSVSGQLINFSNNSSDIVTIGSNSTTSAKFFFDPNQQLGYFGGNVGIGTTSPWRTLSVAGNSDLGTNALAGSFTATSNTIASQFPYASTTAITATTASTTNLIISGIGGLTQCLHVNAQGIVTGTGSDCASGSASAYPFGLAGNATSTLTQFNGGLTAFASSTIGGGATSTGLTINGGATTTQSLVVGGSASAAGSISAGSFYTITNAFGGSYYTNSANNTGYYMDAGAAGYVGQYGIHTGGGGGSNYLALRSGNTDALFVSAFTQNVGIGTTTPWRALSVVGSSDLGTNALAGSFTATSTVASQFPYASTTAITATTASTTNLIISGIGGSTQCLQVNAQGVVTGTGSTCAAAGIAYPFGLAGNATSTLTQFNGGLTALASSTIGNGSGTGGLTINGNATTTGNTYFAGNVGIGTNSASAKLAVVQSAGNSAIVVGTTTAIANSRVFALNPNTIGGWTLYDGGASGLSWNAGLTQFAGNVGIGTTSPWRALSVVGSSDLGTNALAGSFTATSNTASTLPYASSTAITVSGTGYLADAYFTGITGSTQCLHVDSTGHVTGTGSDCSAAGIAYPFGLAGNATSTLTQFNGGLTAFASSTIGGGATSTGLTINGGATTTKSAYFASNVAIGTTSPNATVSIQGPATALAVSKQRDILDVVGGSYTQFGDGQGIQLIAGGLDVSSGNGGDVTIAAGQGGAGGTFAGNINLTAGGNTHGGGIAGNVNITAGGGQFFAGTGIGGNITLNPGAADTYGNVLLATTGGKVGIGTTSPYAKLSVAGQVVGQYFTATSSIASQFPYASTTAITATTASTTNLIISGIGGSTQCLQVNAQGVVTGTGSSCSSGGIAYPFGLAGNATSTLTQFNGGLTAFASSTIGDGTANGGLTVNGNATTTGIAYFANTVGIGTPTPFPGYKLDVEGQLLVSSDIVTTANVNASGYLGWINSSRIYGSTNGTIELTNFAANDLTRVQLGGTTSAYPALARNGAAVSVGLADGSAGGTLGVGTTSPWRALSVEGSSDLGVNALAGSFTATSSVASRFPYASSTALTVSGTGYLADAYFTGITGSTQCLHVDSTGHVTGTGSDCGSGSSLPYAFSLTGNATSTLTQFNGGLTAFASSTIGNGTQIGGLTINGGATTTGTLAVQGAGVSTISGSGLAITSTAFGSGTTVSNHSLAVGGGVLGEEMVATGTGSIAFGYAHQSGNSDGTIISNSRGTLAGGAAQFGFIRSSGFGSVALGYADSQRSDFGYASIIASGDGSFAGGHTQLGDVIASGSGSFFWGESGSSTAAYATGFGTNFRNNQANSFMVGYSAVPTLTVNATGVGIGTTSPYAKLSVAGQVVGQYFTATSSIASQFPYASTTALSASTLFTNTLCLSSDCRTAWPTGGGSGGGTWSTTTSTVAGQLVNYSNNSSDIVAIGSNSTTTSEFFFDPNTGNSLIGSTTGIGTASPRGNLEIRGTGAAASGVGVNPTIVLSDPNVNHGMSLVLPTDVFATIGSTDTGRGSLGITGISTFPSDPGVTIKGIGPSNLNSGLGAVIVQGFIAAGPGTDRIPDAGTVFAVANGNFSQPFNIMGSGNVGLGTTSPWRTLSVNGNSDLGTNALAGYFTATSSVASQFPYASSTALTVSGTAYLANALFTGITGSTQCLHVDSTGRVTGTGSDCGSGGGVAYPFGLAGNATSTLTQFNGGLTAFASSTIGGGATTTGLTINGGATTTGRAYFAGNVGINTTDTTLSGAVNSKLSIVQSPGNTAFAIATTSAGTTGRTFALNANAGGGFTIFDGGVSGSSWNSGLSQLGGNVGIGTAQPALALSVNGTSAAPASSGTATGQIAITGGGTYATILGTFDNGSAPYSWIQGQFRDNAGLTNPLALQPVGGNVGIGTTSPTYPLTIQTNTISAPFAGLGISNAAAAGYSQMAFMGTGKTFFTGVGNASETTLGVANKYFIYNFTDSKTLLALDATGNLGIGTTSPYAKLSVVGQVVGQYFTATSSIASQFPYASTTAITATTASTTNLIISGISGLTQCLHVDASGNVTGTGSDCGSGGGVAYPFGLAGNATSTLTQFNGGLTALASSTIGNGSGTGGLTTFGNATTTGKSYFIGNVGIGTTTPFAKLSIQATSTETNKTLFTIASSTATATSTLFAVLNGGNVGIGTTTPYARLSVAGLAVAQSFNATSTTIASQFPYASTTAITATTASTTNLIISGISGSTQCLHVNAQGVVSGSGSDCGSAVGSAYPFGLAGNATSTLTQFNGGLTAFASSTIGNGTSLGGLTIFGNATTTGTAYFASNVGLGISSPASRLDLLTTGNAAAAITVRDILGNISLELRAGTSTLNNTFIGVGAGIVNQTGNNSTAYGALALNQNTTGSQNAATGYEALFHNTTGVDNTATGYASMIANTTGTDNTADGWQALQHNTSGSFNAALGGGALGANNIGNYNVGVGWNAGYAGQGDFEANVFVGYKTSWNANSPMSSTTEIGYEAGYNYAGNMSTLLGYQAGYDLASGSNNIALGANVDLPSNTGSNQLNIGNLIYGTGVYNGATPSATPAGGKVGIGTTTPWRTLSVTGSSDLGTNALAGSFTATSSVASQFPYASTTAITATTASTTNLIISGIGGSTQCLQVNAQGVVSGTGSACGAGGGGSAYPFNLAGNATSTLTQFNGGLTAFASSTIGGGTNNSGLTIFGGATTTGTAYFASNVGVATTSPFALFSVSGQSAAQYFTAYDGAATSTLMGGLNVGNGGLTYDFTSGVTSISNLATGPMSFDTDAGAISWTDLPIDSTPSAGTPESYSASIGGTPVLTVYGEANGSGAAQNLRVGIGTTSPYAQLSVQGGTGTAPLFAIATTTGQGASFSIDSNGLLTMNTPGATSTINGNLYVNGTLRGTNVYSGDLLFANGFRFTEASTTASSTPGGLDGLYLKNNNMGDLLSVDTRGNLTVTGDVCANGDQCYGRSISNLAASIQALASSTAESSGQTQSALTSAVSHQNATALSLSQLTANVNTAAGGVVDLTTKVNELASTTNDLSTKLDLATSTLASSTATTLATSTSFIQAVASAVQNIIQSASEWVVLKITATLAIFTHVQTETAAVTKGLEMTDQVTGQVYCVTIQNGDFAKNVGSCSATSTPAAPQTAQSSQTPTPSQQTTPNQTINQTPSSGTTSTPVASSTPVVTSNTGTTTATTTQTTSSTSTSTPVVTSNSSQSVSSSTPSSGATTGTQQATSTVTTTTTPDAGSAGNRQASSGTTSSGSTVDSGTTSTTQTPTPDSTPPASTPPAPPGTSDSSSASSGSTPAPQS